MNLRKMVLLWTLKTKRNFQVRITLLIVKFFVDRSSFGASFLTDTVGKRPQSKTKQLTGNKLLAVLFQFNLTISILFFPTCNPEDSITIHTSQGNLWKVLFKYFWMIKALAFKHANFYSSTKVKSYCYRIDDTKTKKELPNPRAEGKSVTAMRCLSCCIYGPSRPAPVVSPKIQSLFLVSFPAQLSLNRERLDKFGRCWKVTCISPKKTPDLQSQADLLCKILLTDINHSYKWVQ